MSSQGQRVEKKRVTIIGRFFGFFISLFLSLIMGLFLSIIVEWIGMTAFYNEEGFNHAKEIYEIERTYLNEDFNLSFMTESPQKAFEEIKGTVYHYTVKSTGVESLLLKLTNELKLLKQSDPGAYEESRFKKAVRNYLLSAVYITHVYSIRVCILFLSLPVLLLGIFYGAAKGLNARSVRRWQGGRESATVFHWAKLLWGMVFLAPFVIYLAIPFSVHPSIVIIPCVAVISYNTFVLTAMYKKYI